MVAARGPYSIMDACRACVNAVKYRPIAILMQIICRRLRPRGGCRAFSFSLRMTPVVELRPDSDHITLSITPTDSSTNSIANPPRDTSLSHAAIRRIRQFLIPQHMSRVSRWHFLRYRYPHSAHAPSVVKSEASSRHYRSTAPSTMDSA